MTTAFGNPASVPADFESAVQGARPAIVPVI
jgi:hypothetical protein